MFASSIRSFDIEKNTCLDCLSTLVRYSYTKALRHVVFSLDVSIEFACACILLCKS